MPAGPHPRSGTPARRQRALGIPLASLARSRSLEPQALPSRISRTERRKQLKRHRSRLRKDHTSQTKRRANQNAALLRGECDGRVVLRPRRRSSV